MFNGGDIVDPFHGNFSRLPPPKDNDTGSASLLFVFLVVFDYTLLEDNLRAVLLEDLNTGILVPNGGRHMGQGGMILIHDVGVGTLALVGVGIDATGQIHGLRRVDLEVLVLAIVALNFILITISVILISIVLS